MYQTSISPDVTAECIALRVTRMMDFWKDAHGWAPIEAANLLNKSMLEWQKSLASCLSLWTRELSTGEIILAWANIGALVEGQLKLFLSVFYKDYTKNIDAAIKTKDGAIKDPDGLKLEALRQFFQKNIWDEGEPWGDWILKIQKRRNAIHAFQSKIIGDTEELHNEMQMLLRFIERIDRQLPYPFDFH